MDARTRHAFTLVELMVVMTILLLLVMLLLPTFSTAKESARRSVCQANLSQISKAYTTRRTEEGPPTSKTVLSVYEWKVALLPYVSGNNAAFVCPDDENYDTKKTQTVVETPPQPDLPGYKVTTPTQSGLPALRVYRGQDRLCDLPLEEGPLTQRRAAPAGYPPGSYVLGFEDERNMDGTIMSNARDVGQYDSPVLIISPDPATGKTTITVDHGWGEFHWDLVSPTGSMLLYDVGNGRVSAPGASVQIAGILGDRAGVGSNAAPGSTITYANFGCSYGINALAASISTGIPKVLMMDFPTPAIQIANPSADVGDNAMWQTGTYAFARHFAKANVLFADGGVQMLDPIAMDPVMIDTAEFGRLWKP